jgi:hypothetical protein
VSSEGIRTLFKVLLHSLYVILIWVYHFYDITVPENSYSFGNNGVMGSNFSRGMDACTHFSVLRRSV